MTIYVAGNSHTGALAQGLALLKPPLREVKAFALGSGAEEITHFAERVGDRVVMRSATYAKRLVTETGLASIGNEHVWVFVMGSHNMRILRDNFWRDAAPSSLQLEGKRPISEGVLNKIIHSDQKNILNFLSDLKKVGARFIVASCPPVRRDILVDRLGIPAEVVSHVNTRALSSLYQWVEEQNIPIVLPPKVCMDDAGFLRHEFAKLKTATGAIDPHHANARYGGLMIREILKAVKQAYPEALQSA